MTTKRTSLIKPRHRRSDAELVRLLSATTAILDGEDDAITIRHLFYRLVGEGVIEKTEHAYKGLCSHLTKWRRVGHIPWDSFVDSTRWHIGSRLFSGMDEALERTVETYRRDLWASQDTYIECWVEKDAIASIIHRAADSWGVKTFVCRGFPSLSSLYSAAATFRRHGEDGKELAVLYFGDHDPSGVTIDRRAAEILTEDFGVIVEFVRVAVTPRQIREMSLPTRPVKKSDTRAKNWEGGCVEVDTIRPSVLRDLVEQKISDRIDRRQWVIAEKIETAERETLEALRLSAARS